MAAANATPTTPPRLRCRAATAADAAAIAALIFASGEAEFRYLLATDAAGCIDFLRRVSGWSHGHFSWRRHRVALADSQLVGIIAIQDGRAQWADNPLVAHAFVRHFGWRKALGIMRRGIYLEREIPPPKRPQTLLAHCATAADWRSRGVFQHLFAQARQQQLLPADPSQTLVLDVLASNPRAMALYQRCGFTALPRKRPLDRHLPAELASIRMQFSGPAVNDLPR